MIKINIIAVGDLKEKYLVEATAEYTKRLKRFCELNIIEVSESKKPDPRPEEGRVIKEKLKGGFTIALDIKGAELSSEELSAKLSGLMTSGHSTLNFIIGGSQGLDKELLKSCDFRLSFSKLTFPHQLMRVILLEQIYRAFTIQNNITYHK